MHMTEHEQHQLQETLSYLSIDDLKTLLKKLNLSPKAFNKNELIQRLVHYAQTGTELAPAEIHPDSRASRGKIYALDPNELMLHGSYKNDLKTRQFFKQLIGNHFHFTAQGIDWLRERWIAGNPPTYAEFAHEWQKEYDHQKIQKRKPKQEWALIRFCLGYMEQFPEASTTQMFAAWRAKKNETTLYINELFLAIQKHYTVP